MASTYGYARVSSADQNEARQIVALTAAGIDRFVLIDNTELHNLGSSINSLGAHACAPFGFTCGECSLRSKASSAHFRLTTYTTRDPKEIAKLLALLS